MFSNITIIGDGGMGSVCAMLLCQKGLHVTMWGYDADQLAKIEKHGENIKFLPGYKLPPVLVFEPNDAKAMLGASLLISAVPCQFTRGIWERLKEHVPHDIPSDLLDRE